MYNIGSAYSALGKYEDALVFFDRSIKIDSSDQKAFFNRGNAKSKLKDFQSAIKDYERSIKINPKNGGIYWHW